MAAGYKDDGEMTTVGLGRLRATRVSAAARWTLPPTLRAELFREFAADLNGRGLYGGGWAPVFENTDDWDPEADWE